MKSQTITKDKLQDYTDEELFTEIVNRKYTELEAYGAVVQVIENACGRSDRLYGNGEEGLHGRSQGEAKNVKPV